LVIFRLLRIEPLLLGSERLKEMLPNDEVVSIVLRNAKKLQTLSNTILDASRIEGDTFKIYKEGVNIKDIISDALELTNGRSSSYDKESQVKIIYEPYDIFIRADRYRITQVVSNILNNAVKSTKEQEQQETERVISLITQRRGDSELVISIIDNGKGIDPEVMPRLSSKFATRSFDGTGFGLFIAKSIGEAHGGKIWAGNNSDGKGATFSFSIPLLS
jgi:signal transduction histidine kinase